MEPPRATVRRRRPRTAEQRTKESQQKRQKVDQLLQLREQVLALERTLRRLIAIQVHRHLLQSPNEETATTSHEGTDLQLATLAFMLSCSNRGIARLRQLTSQTRHGFRQRLNEVSDEIEIVLRDCLPQP
ncbi:hypothetical protein PINS_up011625 [Pythium insidiosum]|nr:hypothetical protein PINS_up011625 [Pythium insidiosum]